MGECVSVIILENPGIELMRDLANTLKNIVKDKGLTLCSITRRA
jgi:hypothetical protein